MGDELINLLERFINENKLLKEEFGKCKTNEALYKELISVLKEEDLVDKKIFIIILLNTIYGNNIYVDEFCNILLQPDKEVKLKKFMMKIISEYEKIKDERRKLGERLYRNKEMVSSAYRGKVALKYHKRIADNKNDVRNIKKIINYYEVSNVISSRDEMLLINEIELHNKRVAAKDDVDIVYTENMYNELPNILSIGFQKHDEVEIDSERKPTIDRFVKELRNMIDNSIESDEIENNIKAYRRYNLDSDEFKYLIIKLMDYYLDELIALYELLIEKEIYTYKKDRVGLIKNYYYILEKYLVINNYYNSICNEKEEFVLEELSDDVDLEIQNQLVYARSDVNVYKARIVSDMSDIPYEYYDTVYDLIDRFKNGKLSKKEIKTLSSGRKIRGHIELKYDQVRIILKHIKDNLYCVLGAFAKKADNDIEAYTSIVSRKIPVMKTEEEMDNQLELSEYTEKELKEIVANSARKGTR